MERVHTNKFLGVVIDDKLSWHHHIAQSLSVVYKVNNILNVNSLKYFYNALISPYLFYNCEVWGNASKYLIERVVSLQQRAIRVISRDVTTQSISCWLIAKYYSCQHRITVEFIKQPKIFNNKYVK